MGYGLMGTYTQGFCRRRKFRAQFTKFRKFSPSIADPFFQQTFDEKLKALRFTLLSFRTDGNLNPRKGGTALAVYVLHRIANFV
jgi:hypothetical protein